MDVTVIIPVFNPGPFIEPCLASLVSQSLSDDRYELIFVDDGSTDASPERLDELAAEHHNVIVRHEPNSGWSGRPRNVALDLAHGDYVFFCDHDDWLSPESLERMVDYARVTGADVLAPKIVGHGRGAPTTIFEHNVPDATFATTQIMYGLGPHKLFRRVFLEQLGLRFREGRRFEDQVFVMEAYLRASRIAILADYECYHHFRRPDEANAAVLSAEPAEHVRYVTEVIDVIEAHTQPGPERDLVMRRPFENELLSRFSKRWFDAKPADYQRALLAAVSPLINDRFPAGFGERYGVVTRTRAAAVRAGDFDSVLELSERTARLHGHAELVDIEWDGHAWRAELVAGIVFDDGSPVVLNPVGSDAWQVDSRLLVDGMPTRADSTDELLSARATVEVVGHATAVNWYAPAELPAELHPIDADPLMRQLVLRGSARFDPAVLAGGRPLADDRWNVRIRVSAFGHSVTTRVRPSREEVTAPRPAIVGAPATVVVPSFRGRDNHLSFQVESAARAALVPLLRHAVTAVQLDADELSLNVDIDMAADTVPVPLRVHLKASGKPPGYLAGTVAPSPGGAVLRTTTSPTAADASQAPPAGRFPLVLRAQPSVGLGAYVVVSDRGQVTDAGVGSPRDV